MKGRIEAWWPLTTGVTVFLVLIFFETSVVKAITDYKLSISQLYTGIFGWGSVTTGFLFGVYSLIFSKTDGFISRLNNTRALEIFTAYTRRAVVLGFAITITGIPFLVINSDISEMNNFMYWLGAAYFGLFAHSFSATVRVARLFAAMAKVKDRKRLPA